VTEAPTKYAAAVVAVPDLGGHAHSGLLGRRNRNEIVMPERSEGGSREVKMGGTGQGGSWAWQEWQGLVFGQEDAAAGTTFPVSP